MYPIVEMEKKACPPAGLKEDERCVVLVIEDHADTSALLEAILLQRGLNVVEAEHGEQAVTVAERERPDLILMDAGIPSVDGNAAMRRIRAFAPLAKVPVVFISEYAEPGFRAAAFEAGCDDYIVKPFDLILFDQAIAKRLWVRAQ
jgi:CheY-like chemotaxis protein